MSSRVALYEPIIWQPRTNRVFLSPGFDCPVGCIYCYIYNDGYALAQPTPVKLSGIDLKQKLESDPRFRRGREGTIISIGCDSEPFHPALAGKTLEYMQSLSELGNPIQFATKFPLSEPAITSISKLASPVYPMVSLCSIKNHTLLEPAAPNPDSRLLSLERMVRAGLRVTLLYKPVIPGVNDSESEAIIHTAVEYKASYLVAGIMYANNYLADKLEEKGFDTGMLRQRSIDLVQPVWIKSDISPVRSHDLLDSIVIRARTEGISAFKYTV